MLGSFDDYDDDGWQYYDIEVDCIAAATDKALLLSIDGSSYWCPRSLIDEGDTYESNSAEADFGVVKPQTLLIQDWWLEENHLI